MNDIFFYLLMVIFLGCAVGATGALYLRQAPFVSYIVLGILFGPFGLGLVPIATTIAGIGQVGILFLLFLAGLELKPKTLMTHLSQIGKVVLISSCCFTLIASTIIRLMGFSFLESYLIGISMMFSSTIISLKLLPPHYFKEHHDRGQLLLGIALSQDILAILTLTFIQATGQAELWWEIPLQLLLFPPVLLGIWGVQRFILNPLMSRFSHHQEYIILLAIAFCLSVSELMRNIGFSAEMGAFLAGVSLSQYHHAFSLVARLKPLEDFLLVLFFFAMGATLDLLVVKSILLLALVLGLFFLCIKPFIFTWLMHRVLGKKGAFDVGLRLGQGSEFALIIATKSLEMGYLTESAACLVKATVLLTFVGSAFWISTRPSI